MFGLEEHSGKKKRDQFDLEKDLKSADKQKKMKDHIHNKMLKIKDLLRHGEDQDFFNQLGTVLYGYVSLLKVINRVKIK